MVWCVTYFVPVGRPMSGLNGATLGRCHRLCRESAPSNPSCYATGSRSRNVWLKTSLHTYSAEPLRISDRRTPKRVNMLRLLLQPGDSYEAAVLRRSLEGACSRAVPSGPELAALWLRQVGRMASAVSDTWSFGLSGAALSEVSNGLTTWRNCQRVRCCAAIGTAQCCATPREEHQWDGSSGYPTVAQ